MYASNRTNTFDCDPFIDLLENLPYATRNQTKIDFSKFLASFFGYLYSFILKSNFQTMPLGLLVERSSNLKGLKLIKISPKNNILTDVSQHSN
jgi:hypothetical protein